MDDLQVLFEGFCIDLQASGRRPTTIKWYDKHVRCFLSWLDHENIPKRLSEVNSIRLRQYIVHLQNDVRVWESNSYVPTQDRKLSSAYIAGATRALRGWFNWMQGEGFVHDNPMSKVRTPKIQQKLIEPLETDEIKRFLGSIQGQTMTAARSRAIILLLVDCGLRVSELCSLEVDDVDLKGSWIRVREGKGWKERKIPMGGALRKALWHYSAERPEPLGGSKAFFLTEQGWPLTTDRIRKMLDHYAKKSKVENVHPHRFRHTFALHFLRNGGDPLTLRMLMGHTTLEMVNRYVKLASVDLQSVHAKASPADHLRL